MRHADFLILTTLCAAGAVGFGLWMDSFGAGMFAFIALALHQR